MPLSLKEVEYCKLFLKYKGKEYLICRDMNIKISTSKTHRKSIYDKLNLNSLVELTIHLLTKEDWKVCENYWK